MMHVTVLMEPDGDMVLTNAQGDLLAACFFRAEDETHRELQLLGYQRLIHAYPLAHITAGNGIEPEDLGDVFLER